MPVVEIKDGKTYEDGWIPGPQEELLDAIFSVCPKEAFVAEDLGVMNDGVHALRNHYELPGMKVLQFSFDNLKIDSKTGKPLIRSKNGRKISSRTQERTTAPLS